MSNETVILNGGSYEIKIGPQGGAYIEVIKDATILDPATNQPKQAKQLVRQYIQRCADSTKPDRNDATKTITFKGCGQWVQWIEKRKCNLDGTAHQCSRVGYLDPKKAITSATQQPLPAKPTPIPPSGGLPKLPIDAQPHDGGDEPAFHSMEDIILKELKVMEKRLSDYFYEQFQHVYDALDKTLTDLTRRLDNLPPKEAVKKKLKLDVTKKDPISTEGGAVANGSTPETGSKTD